MTSRALNVVIVHGIGWGEGGKHYARPLQRNISLEFEKAVRKLRLHDVPRSAYDAKSALRFEAAYWAPVTQRPQDALIALMKMGGWPVIRRFNPYYIARRQMVGMLGDVIAYEGGGVNKVYGAIHARIDACVKDLADASADELPDDGYAPLTVIGHSLGSVIASDYVWDSTRGADQPYHFREHPFTVKNMVLMGSPMAIYGLRNNPNADKYDIADALSSPVQVDPVGGTWLNMYDPQDPIAFPLKPIDAYREAGVIDCVVRAGTWFTTLTPMSHVGYWRCHEVAANIGRKLALDWAALNVPDFAGEQYTRALKKYRKEVQHR